MLRVSRPHLPIVECALATGMVCLWTAPLTAGGRLSVSPNALDFGERGHRERPSATLRLSNDGDGPLTIAAIEPSCSCIELRPDRGPAPLTPGKSMEIAVTMGSGRAIGKLEKHITIRTDGAPGLVRVPVGMRVFDGLSQEPRDVVFEGVVGGDPATRTIDLVWSRGRSRPDAQFAVEQVIGAYQRDDVTGPIGRFFSHRVEPIANGWRLLISVLPEHPEGRIGATVSCRLGGKTLEIPVRGEMFRGVLVSPTSINFSRVDVNERETFVEEIRLAATDGRPFAVLASTVAVAPRTRIPGLDLAFTPRPVDDGRSWILEFALRVPGPVWPRGSFSGTVTLATDHPEKPAIELPFFGFFREPETDAATTAPRDAGPPPRPEKGASGGR